MLRSAKLYIFLYSTTLMLNVFPNSIWIENYRWNTRTVRCFPELRFFHDIWRSNRWISVILVLFFFLVCWLQFICWSLCLILFGLRDMNFSCRTVQDFLGCSVSAAARVLRLFFLINPVDCFLFQSTTSHDPVYYFHNQSTAWPYCCMIAAWLNPTCRHVFPVG